MRFSSAVLFAGAAVAQVTTTQTSLTTVTSCGPEVTNCPGTVAPPPPATNQTTSTIYSTQITTVISCPVTVVDCPARSTQVKTITIAIGTTVCDVAPTGGKYQNATMVVPPPTKATIPPPKETGAPPKETSPPKPEGPKVAACPTYSVKTISTSVTTVVPTVIYETVAIPCPSSETKPTPSAGAPKPTGGAGGNGTITPPPVKAGASSFGTSAVFAVVAGAAAFYLA